MATATQPVIDASNSVDIKTYNDTYRVYVKLGTDGKIDPQSIKMTTSGKDNSAWTKLDQDPEYKLALEQTAKEYAAGTVAGAALLIEDQEELVNVINRGIAQKLGQKLKATFTEISEDGLSLVFDPVAGAFDTLELLNEATKRRNLSPEDKALRSVRDAVKNMFPGLEGDALEQRVLAFFSSMKG